MRATPDANQPLPAPLPALSRPLTPPLCIPAWFRSAAEMLVLDLLSWQLHTITPHQYVAQLLGAVGLGPHSRSEVRKHTEFFVDLSSFELLGFECARLPDYTSPPPTFRPIAPPNCRPDPTRPVPRTSPSLTRPLAARAPFSDSGGSIAAAAFFCALWRLREEDVASPSPRLDKVMGVLGEAASLPDTRTCIDRLVKAFTALEADHARAAADKLALRAPAAPAATPSSPSCSASSSETAVAEVDKAAVPAKAAVAKAEDEEEVVAEAPAEDADESPPSPLEKPSEGSYEYVCRMPSRCASELEIPEIYPDREGEGSVHAGSETTLAKENPEEGGKDTFVPLTQRDQQEEAYRGPSPDSIIPSTNPARSASRCSNGPPAVTAPGKAAGTKAWGSVGSMLPGAETAYSALAAAAGAAAAEAAAGLSEVEQGISEAVARAKRGASRRVSRDVLEAPERTAERYEQVEQVQSPRKQRKGRAA